MTSSIPADPRHPTIRSTRTGRLRSALERILRHPASDIAIMGLILASITLVLIEAHGVGNATTLRRIHIADWAISAFFIVELSTRWFLAPSTKQHFRDYWLDWLAVIPPLRAARALRLFRLIRVLRLLRLYRAGTMAQRFVLRKHSEFEKQVRDEIAHYRGRFAEQVWLVPDLFHMFGNLLEDGRVDDDARHLITASLAYFVTPFDIFPEEIYGAEGWMDQAYLCLWTVRELHHGLPDHVLREAWEGEGDILQIIEEELPLLEPQVGAENVTKLRRYLGLGGFELRQA
jgi:uncharacterized membrane protein YkvA (DUF1232 family)